MGPGLLGNRTARRHSGPALTGRFRSDHGVTKIAAMERLGRVPASGHLRIELSPERTSLVPDGAVGCLDTRRWTGSSSGSRQPVPAADRLRRHRPGRTAGRHTGTAVVAAPRIAGGVVRPVTVLPPGRGVPRADRRPLDGSSTSLTCTFHPPGLRLGSAVGGVTLLTLVALTALPAVPPTTCGGHHELTRSFLVCAVNACPVPGRFPDFSAVGAIDLVPRPWLCSVFPFC